MPDLLTRVRTALEERYEVESECRHTCCAFTYRARDRLSDCSVAIKVLRPGLVEGLTLDAVTRQCDPMRRFDHPLVASVLDVGESDGLFYLVARYLDGETLRARLDLEAQLPIVETIRIACDVADALSHVHENGVVHRDIKPEHIVLVGGHALITDFALPVRLGKRLLSGEGDIAIGTPSYMSPEQVVGGDGVDGRADLYSLGVVMYEMLAGEPPFTGRTAHAIIAKHAHAQPIPLQVMRPDVPESVWKAVELALAKVPADRYQTAHQFLESMAALLESLGEADTTSSS